MTPLLLVPDTITAGMEDMGPALAVATGMVVLVGPDSELDKIRTVGDCPKCDGELIKRYDPEGQA